MINLSYEAIKELRTMISVFFYPNHISMEEDLEASSSLSYILIKKPHQKKTVCLMIFKFSSGKQFPVMTTL